MILPILHLHFNLLLHCKFQLNSPCSLQEDVQTDIQDGDHLGFLINRILAHFDPEVVLLLQSKFWLKSIWGLGIDVEQELRQVGHYTPVANKKM